MKKGGLSGRGADAGRGGGPGEGDGEDGGEGGSSIGARGRGYGESMGSSCAMKPWRGMSSQGRKVWGCLSGGVLDTLNV
jgi:hypothetical protein